MLCRDAIEFFLPLRQCGPLCGVASECLCVDRYDCHDALLARHRLPQGCAALLRDPILRVPLGDLGFRFGFVYTLFPTLAVGLLDFKADVVLAFLARLEADFSDQPTSIPAVLNHYATKYPRPAGPTEKSPCSAQPQSSPGVPNSRVSIFLQRIAALQGRQFRGVRETLHFLCNNGFRVGMLEANNLICLFGSVFLWGPGFVCSRLSCLSKNRFLCRLAEVVIVIPEQVLATSTVACTLIQARVNSLDHPRFYNIQFISLVRMIEMAVRTPSATGAGIKAIIDTFDEASGKGVSIHLL